MTDTGAVLLYDGTCGFCARSVQFVLQHEGERKTLRFASLQSPVGTAVRARHHELDAIDSIIWFEPASAAREERVLVRSRAVLAVAAYLGGIWRALGAVGHVLPRALRDAGYDFIARRRHELPGIAPACLLPSSEQRKRFLES
ncbi:MAG: DCC1-like thiol-disulfide oxidoreductase family protein [Gemmatimonadaceae bacterium]